MKIFSVDGPLYKLMTSITNVFLISMCFWLSCVPIVTIGAGIVAACDIGMKLVKNEEGYIVRQYFKSLKNNFKQGFLLEIILFVGLYAAYLDFMLFNAVKSNPIMFPIAGILTIFLVISGTVYAFPQVARYENKLSIIVRNSFRICIKYMFRTILTLFVMGLLLLAFFYNYTTLFMGILIGPGCLFYVISSTARGIFGTLEHDDKVDNLTGEDTDYVQKETELHMEQHKFANALDEEDMKKIRENEKKEAAAKKSARKKQGKRGKNKNSGKRKK